MTGLPAGDTLRWREEGILVRRESVYGKNEDYMLCKRVGCFHLKHPPSTSMLILHSMGIKSYVE